ncbi:hypothetical protein E2562_027881 [Oryza meyeriana var. granulata]|uniref:Uncharacterized protein n=1 Tax=Oryza meyeriana var. granulata TaxID=110450 RepID=A0A6G1CTL3_9ORYZ|nr:hypothetical protein E2562_027881 [Oryza meyeriana var. granulata]
MAGEMEDNYLNQAEQQAVSMLDLANNTVQSSAIREMRVGGGQGAAWMHLPPRLAVGVAAEDR